ncbi:MAG: hypothetical protein HKM93_03745 [Desulfobacteraceae bacterium]|nr:hypothetical protein [Desulfobacteraceae bacterium]
MNIQYGFQNIIRFHTETAALVFLSLFLLVFVPSANADFKLQDGEKLEKTVHSIVNGLITHRFENILIIDDEAYRFSTNTEFYEQRASGESVRIVANNLTLPCTADIVYATFSTNYKEHPFGREYRGIEKVVVKKE